jgi:hypothetical protein
VTPIAHFDAVWTRCAQLSALHTYLENNVAGILQPDVLRAEWVARVSALDLYVHELIAQNMVATYEVVVVCDAPRLGRPFTPFVRPRRRDAL